MDHLETEGCRMDFPNPPDDKIREILSKPATVAVIGCSDDPARDSLMIAQLLKTKGFRVIPVNPQLEPEALRKELGQRCYPDLDSIPDRVDIVDVFRRAEYLPEIAEQAVRKGARVLWGQLGVVNLKAAELARNAGMTVVMDRCPAIEYRRLF
jgi:predicted CoA-binding protein